MERENGNTVQQPIHTQDIPTEEQLQVLLEGFLDALVQDQIRSRSILNSDRKQSEEKLGDIR